MRLAVALVSIVAGAACGRIGFGAQPDATGAQLDATGAARWSLVQHQVSACGGPCGHRTWWQREHHCDSNVAMHAT